MASTAQLQQELVNAVTRVRLGDGGPVQVKFSDGKTRTVYRDGSGAEDLPGVNFRDLEGRFNEAESSARPAPVQQPQQQQQQPQQQPAPQTTPIAQVAPQAAPTESSGYQLPTLNQSLIDKQFRYGKDRSNELTIGNSDIRDQIYNAGWKEKSDAVRVLTGAGNYGIVSNIAGMGGSEFKNLQGGIANDNDFIAAAQAAGIQNPSQYQKAAGTSLGTIGSKVLDQGKIFSLLQEKGKDLYTVTNAIEGAKRGDAAIHATATYKSDGSGNLVPVTNAATGQPDVKYFEATRYNEAPGFMDTYGPFLMLAPAFGGILQSAGVIPTFGSATGTAAGSAGGGFVGGGFGSIGPAGFTASAAAPITAGLTAEQIAKNVGAFPANAGGYGSIGTGAATTNPSSWAAANEAAGLGTSPAGMLSPYAAATIGANSLGSLVNNAAGATTAQKALSSVLGNSGLINALGSGGQALGSYLSGQAQADAAREAARNQMLMFNTINQQFAPQRGAGYQSLNQIRSMLPGQSMTYNELGQPSGVQTGTDYLTRQFSPQDLQAGLAPNYQFMLGQGQQAQQRAANVGGGLIGGNALRGLEDYTQNYAQNAYQNAFGNFQNQRTGIYNTLAGIAGLGQQAQNTTAQAGQAATTAQGQLGVGAAAAQAAGLTGAANAAQGGLQNYQQNQILQAILGQNQNVAQTATPPYAP
tara:strand:- start:26878 stop:28959 length:2082 start_codon:yes stop_codon:yes gene_type:complete